MNAPLPMSGRYHRSRRDSAVLKPDHPRADGTTMDTAPAPHTAMSSTARVHDEGSTFIEILISIVLLGFAVMAVIGGLRVVILASSASNDQAKVEAVLTSAADRLAATDYIPCPSLANGDYAYLAGAASASVDDPSWASGGVVTIENISYWQAGSGSARNAAGDPIEADGSWGPSNGLTCNSDINLTTSRTLQRITIRVTAPSGGVSRTIEVVKSPIVANPPDPTATTTSTTPPITP